MSASAPAARRPLAKNTKNLSGPSAVAVSPAELAAKQAKRNARFTLREVLWDVSKHDRARVCGRRRISSKTGVGIHGGEVAHMSNVQLCGSVWACPVCTAKIRQRRADETRAVLLRHLAAGGGAYFGMLTVPHDVGMPLARTLDVCQKGFSRVLAGRAYGRDREAFGIVGTIKAAETTHGANGWHPHVHPLVLTARRLTADELAELVARMYGRWADAAESMGLARPLPRWCTLKEVASAADVAAYLSKVEGADVEKARKELRKKARGLSLEMTRSDLKTGRVGVRGRSPWEILASVAATGDCDDLALWHEYELATKGRQSVTFSNGLKALYKIDEKTDEEIAAEEVGGELLYTMDDEEAKAVFRTRGGAAAVLDAAEHGGVPAIRAVLAAIVDDYGRRLAKRFGSGGRAVDRWAVNT